MRFKSFISAVFLLTVGLTKAQPYVRLQPLGHRIAQPVENTVLQQIAWGISDTLTLPFFEDFSHEIGYPQSDRWTDNLVWINNSFPKKAPNFGVATFDHLDAHGNPYQTLDKRNMVFADSLTSQPINLQFKRIGSQTINYKPTDSIYISFFVQRQGIGDAPELEDSLLLYFKNIRNEWVRVWALPGGFVGDFKEYFAPIAHYDYLTPNFQFRFVNFTKATGNLNHWHLDYIRIEKNRRFGEKTIQDVGVNQVSSGLFMDYSNVPFSHYRYNNSIRGTGPSLVAKNLNSIAVQTRFQLSIFNQYNKQVYLKPFSASTRNLAANGDTTEKYESLLFDSLSTATPKLKYIYSINPQSNDITPDNYNAETNNNTIIQSHTVMPWYAYDDGSAEGGFGLDYAFLGNLKGQFAMDFNVIKSDSLRGLAVYFNQSLTDVSARSFKLRIWKAISPIGRPDNQDQLIYEVSMARPIYSDSINGFSYIFFDSALYLPAGKYYVGWLQQMPYVLNIGYDNNYRYQGKDQSNPHLYSNLLGSWEFAGGDAKGTPMIRMLFGERIEYAFSNKTISKPTLALYPNPCVDYIHLNGNSNEGSKIEIWDISGKLHLHADYSNRIFVGDLMPGHYYLRCIGKNSQITYNHFIKL
ncbi:MAG: hypothetical protein RIS50_312 [Bacteroidota bacterium]|jgi:hypothetical protein